MKNWTKQNTLISTKGFPGGSDGKGSMCNAGGLGLIPGERNGYPVQYPCLGNPHGQRRLEGYSPRDHKESDTTEPLTLSGSMVS